MHILFEKMQPETLIKMCLKNKKFDLIYEIKYNINDNNRELFRQVYREADRMFLHIGGDVVIPIRDIIAILDIETTTMSKDTKDFLRVAEEEGFIVSISNDLPKSFIITEIDNKSKIFLSPISSVTLQKRYLNPEEVVTSYI